MEFIVWIETRLAGKTLAVEEVAKFDRCASGISSEEIGLTLQEGKDVLKHVQRNGWPAGKIRANPVIAGSRPNRLQSGLALSNDGSLGKSIT